MPIKVADTAGFCFGVKRAVDSVYASLDKGEKIATLGDIIHNNSVIEDLKSKGVYSFGNVCDIPDGYSIVIRAHGVGRDVYEKIGDREYIDLTCPYVKKNPQNCREISQRGLQNCDCRRCKTSGGNRHKRLV